jgi:hypothetical protein
MEIINSDGIIYNKVSCCCHCIECKVVLAKTTENAVNKCAICEDIKGCNGWMNKEWTDSLEQGTPENIDDINGVNDQIKKDFKYYYRKYAVTQEWKDKVREINKQNYAKRKAKKEEEKLNNPIVKEKKTRVITKEEKKVYNDTYINKKKDVMVLCDCGHEYPFIQRTQHYNTKKHIDSLKKKQE